MKKTRQPVKARSNQSGKVVVKFFWLASIILSLLLMLLINLVFRR